MGGTQFILKEYLSKKLFTLFYINSKFYLKKYSCFYNKSRARKVYFLEKKRS